MTWRKHLLPALTLGGIVIASATQTEAAHTLTAEWEYNQPYFTFYITHSTFSLVFPIHLAILAVLKPTPWRTHISDVRLVLADQLRLSPLASWKDIMRVYSRKIVWLTILISIPALAWFVAMLYSPALDVSAIYATSAFWAYFFSMWLLGEQLSRITVGSIALAFAGVIVLSLDGLKEGEEEESEGRGRAFGDIVMLIGAIILGLYEVVYKMVLPESAGGVPSSESSTLVDSYDPLPAEEFEQADEESGTETPINNEQTPHRTLKSSRSMIPLMPSPSTAARTIANYGNDDAEDGGLDTPLDVDTTDPHPHLPLHRFSGPPALPPALLSNFLTSCIGIATFLMGFPLIFVFDFLGWETFRWPAGEGVSTMTMWSTIEVVAITGSIYNAGLMILIGIWGPTTSSVANLLTIGLVAVLDAVVMAVMPSLRALIGVGMICAGFGILLWEGEG